MFKEKLHELVDALPKTQIGTATTFLSIWLKNQYISRTAILRF